MAGASEMNFPSDSSLIIVVAIEINYMQIMFSGYFNANEVETNHLFI